MEISGASQGVCRNVAGVPGALLGFKSVLGGLRVFLVLGDSKGVLRAFSRNLGVFQGVSGSFRGLPRDLRRY